jgi:hypothetical protein
VGGDKSRHSAEGCVDTAERSKTDLESIWAQMDEAWDEYGCDLNVMDERISTFYWHPVWLLNGQSSSSGMNSLASIGGSSPSTWPASTRAEWPTSAVYTGVWPA